VVVYRDGLPISDAPDTLPGALATPAYDMHRA
jgi:hypothetical protein